MNDILQQIMNMIENTRTVPSISSFSMIGFTVLLIFGVINCILGYRLLRFWMMLCGFVIGAGIGFGAAYTGGVTEKYMYAVFMVGAGVLLAVIAFVSYKIGIFDSGSRHWNWTWYLCFSSNYFVGILFLSPSGSGTWCVGYEAGEGSSDHWGQAFWEVRWQAFLLQN